MKETIKYDACDEVSVSCFFVIFICSFIWPLSTLSQEFLGFRWVSAPSFILCCVPCHLTLILSPRLDTKHTVNGKYPLSNACGQLGQSYQDYHCPENEKHMECPVDPNMEITAVTHAKW
jgi:hypothetical protein